MSTTSKKNLALTRSQHFMRAACTSACLRTVRWFFVVISMMGPVKLVGSADIDDRYAFRSVVTVVVNTHEEPLYGEQVQNALADYFRNHSRFDYSEEIFEPLKEFFKLLHYPLLTNPKEFDQTALAPFFETMAKKKIHALMVAEVIPYQDHYLIQLVLFNARTKEFIHSAQAQVDNPKRLYNFAQAARLAAQNLVESLPFQAAVLSRDGYRVVLDRGLPEIRKGMHLATHTLEIIDGELKFIETGALIITRSEKNLSFAKVIADKNPLTIAAGNKIRGGRDTYYAEGIKILDSISDRMPATLEDDQKLIRGNYGCFHSQLLGSLVTINNSASDGSVFSSASSFFPGGRVLGEFFATGRIYAQIGFEFATSSIKDRGQSLSSSLSNVLGVAGYRLLGTVGTPGPSIDLFAGLSNRRYQVDTSDAPVSFTSIGYSGMILGSRAKYPFTDDWAAGFQINAWLFSSASESPLTSGEKITGVSGWDVSAVGYYRYSPALDIELNITAKNNTCEFSGQGTRQVALFSASHQIKAISLGMSYYF